jgi:hypothetical protein
MTSKYKTFKDYYHTDPEFRKKHLERLNEKIVCQCGFETSRSNLSRHMRSHIHIQKMEKINKISELKKELKRLENEL